MILGLIHERCHKTGVLTTDFRAHVLLDHLHQRFVFGIGLRLDEPVQALPATFAVHWRV
jgi:hypothetical protein